MSAARRTASTPLPAGFFDRPAEVVARELLGKVLVSTVGGVSAAGVIVETEAYLGSDDPGSHAATRGITPRNRVMYGPPAHVYVYFTYGNHHMLNLVTGPEGTAGAVLVRALEPSAGAGVMSERRRGTSGADLTNGPGKLAEALGVDLRHNGVALGGEVTVYDAPPLPDEAVATSGRIGLSAGHESMLRFFVVGNGYVSRGRPGPKPARRSAPTTNREKT